MAQRLSRTHRRMAARAALLAAAALAAPVFASAAQSIEDLKYDLGGIFNSVDRGNALSLVEGLLERELPKRVGPADRYEVRLDRKGADLFHGRLGRADVTGLGVRTRDGLVIPRMDLQLQDVRFSPLSRSLSGIGKGDFTAFLGQEAVSRYVTRRIGANVRDVSVGFRRGQVLVKGTPELLGFGLPSEVAGKPVLNGRDAVDFRASRVEVLGLRVPDFAVQELERKINPVVDLSGLNLPVRITKLAIEGDRLAAAGALDFGARTGDRRRQRAPRD